jgi:hypothetical protein
MSDTISSYWNTNDTTGLPSKPVQRLKDVSDPIVENVKRLLTIRSKVGIAKYDTTLEDSKLTTLQWLQHLQEELLDGACYIERLKKDLDK